MEHLPPVSFHVYIEGDFSSSECDQQILQLKADGFTLKEIAAKVGYQNHSAVSKRIHHISEKYAEYRNQ